MMNTTFSAARLALLALPLVAGAALASEGQDLTFQGDASFQGPHGGQAIQAAVVDTATGDTIAVKTGEVAADADPAFSFVFTGALMEGGSYAVHYWIDSNFGGGSPGQCDDMQHDHQWSVPIEAGAGPVTHTEGHDPSAQSAVCETFR
ncbi:hypothetical protein ACFPTY_00870 [Halomonas beimenensis]|uniref:Uncharacterized protein n=1 Tax=Halomonas beimenensis TaxID=475662 RepID=A0A291P3R9_9GAMM|nr:hypothetical protein [Halomonas beimenensis]ATJ81505.1 hypothetical protein BEI_0518 [Halomonas beimenensis]